VYRLPTEAEWEYACRGGAKTPFHCGVSLPPGQANFDGTQPYAGGVRGSFLDRTTEVGSYPPNGFGLYDMHGNVWEWCADLYDKDYYKRSPSQDPTGPSGGVGWRIERGGSYFSPGCSCRAASRFSGPPDKRHCDIGFRVACSVAPKSQ
jgi:formylglycine-generating enzyme required for sulfatase activity